MTQAGALTITRDPKNGRVTGTSLGGVTDAYGYDATGALASYVARYEGTTLYSETIVSRDGVGRITQNSETLGSVQHEWVYTYDTAGRLTDVAEDGAATSHYTYDVDDNRTSYMNASGTTFATYDAQDRLQTYGGATYGYGANGELQSRTGAEGVTSYAYDVFGNLLSAGLPDGTALGYVVDGQNRRVGKQVNGALTTGFLYQDQLNTVAQLDGSGNVVSRFVFGSKPNVPDYYTTSAGTIRILSDHLGSPRLIVNTASGSVVEEIEYDEFGNVTNDTAPGTIPFGFAGGLRDLDTGLVRFGARDYDPSVGRWTSKDPIRFQGKQINFYVYASNDPINTRDPSGNISQTCVNQITQNCQAACEAAAASHCVPGIGVSACTELCLEVQEAVEFASPGTLCADTAQCLALAGSSSPVQWGTYCLQFGGSQRGSCYAIANQSSAVRTGWCLANF